MTGNSSSLTPPHPPLPDESITVIIPLYNGARHLREAIESVLAQTKKPQQIIVIDDQSSDDSLAIAQSYPGLQVLSQQNAGVSATRNRGVAMTSAAWIAFLDQDDYWAPEKLERQIETIRAFPQTDVCVAGKSVVTQIGTTDRFQTTGLDIPPPSKQIATALYRRLRFPPSCVLIRRSAFLASGGFVPVATPCEDWDLWLRMEQAGAHFTSCREPLTFYRLHTHNVSNNGPKMYQGEMRVYELLIAPRRKAWLRPFYRSYAQSIFLAGLALMERDRKKPSLGIIVRSILKFPFGYWLRYKIAAHMLFHRTSTKT